MTNATPAPRAAETVTADAMARLRTIADDAGGTEDDDTWAPFTQGHAKVILGLITAAEATIAELRDAVAQERAFVTLVATFYRDVPPSQDVWTDMVDAAAALVLARTPAASGPSGGEA